MAYNLNGSSRYLYTTSVPVQTLPISICAWFNSNSSTDLQVVVGLSQATLGAAIDLELGGNIANDPVTAVDFRNNVLRRAQTTAGYSTGQWQHGGAVFSSNTSRTAYLNGGNSATNTDAGGGTEPAFNKVAIGVYFNSVGAQFSRLNGLIAEVGIWNAALTAAEIASLAKGMTCDKIRPQNLAFYAPLVRDLIDAKGGLTITNNNTATVSNHTRIYG